MEVTEISGHLILMMAPMASGKGQLVNHVLKRFPEVTFLVSCTTREPRPGEMHGINYYFISHAEFDQKIADDEFLEWAEFSGNKYGTLKSEISKPLHAGRVVLNEIELQGIKILADLIPEEKQTLIYIEAGGWDTLLARMKARAPMSEEHITLRYERYLEEIKAKPFADVVISNHDGELEQAKQHIEAVVEDIFSTVQKRKHTTV